MNSPASRLRPWGAVVLATVRLALGAPAWAQTKTVRLAKQFGISYLPLTIMEQKKLLEEHGKRLGLDLKTDWVTFTSGAPMNEAIISGNLDFASGGVGPLLTIWGRTRNNIGGQGRGGDQLHAALSQHHQSRREDRSRISPPRTASRCRR